MLKKIIFKIVILLVFSFSFSNEYKLNETLAKIGEKEITVSDFLKRAEYSPRPLYCRGNTTLDKRIILNTLIGEKLFSMDLNLEHLPKEIDTYLIGRKKQKMREILFEKVNQDNNLKIESFAHWFNLEMILYKYPNL